MKVEENSVTRDPINFFFIYSVLDDQSYFIFSFPRENIEKLKKNSKFNFLKTKVDLYFRQEVLHTKFMVNAIIDRHRSIIPENFIFQLQTIYANTRGQRKKTGS